VRRATSCTTCCALASSRSTTKTRSSRRCCDPGGGLEFHADRFVDERFGPTRAGRWSRVGGEIILHYEGGWTSIVRAGIEPRTIVLVDPSEERELGTPRAYV
jgi:hypothetical protein